MVQNDTQTAVPVSPTQTVQLGNPLERVEQAYPNRAGFVRRIHPIYQSYFRVNFHELDHSFMVKDSYFVQVTDDKVVTMN